MKFAEQNPKIWAENMGLLPKKDKSGQVIWDSTRAKTKVITVNGKAKRILNSSAPFHMPTNGVAITKKVVKDKKKIVLKKNHSIDQAIPSHILEHQELCDRQYAKNLPSTVLLQESVKSGDRNQRTLEKLINPDPNKKVKYLYGKAGGGVRVKIRIWERNEL